VDPVPDPLLIAFAIYTSPLSVQALQSRSCPYVSYATTAAQSRSQWHVATDCQSVSQSVCLSWCRAPPVVHDQILFTVRQLRYCTYEDPSLTRGRVCHLSESQSAVTSQQHTIFTFYMLLYVCMYNIYKAPAMAEVCCSSCLSLPSVLNNPLLLISTERNSS
jgi:hypothetical protein